MSFPLLPLDISSVLLHGDVHMDSVLEREEERDEEEFTLDFSPQNNQCTVDDRAPSEVVGLHYENETDWLFGSPGEYEENMVNWPWSEGPDDHLLHDYSTHNLLIPDETTLDYSSPEYGSLDTYLMSTPTIPTMEIVEPCNPVLLQSYMADPSWSFDGGDYGDRRMDLPINGTAEEGQDAPHPSPPSSPPHLPSPSPPCIPYHSTFSWWSQKAEDAPPLHADHTDYTIPVIPIDKKKKRISHPDDLDSMRKQLYELYDIKETNHMSSDKEKLRYCALILNTHMPTNRNINMKLALKKLLTSQCSPREIALAHGLPIKAVVRHCKRLLVEAQLEKSKMDMTVLAAVERNDEREKAKEEAMKEEKKRIVSEYTKNKKRKRTNEMTQVFSTEEEVIIAPSLRGDMEQLALCFSLAFSGLSAHKGWERRRGVKETLATLNGAILDGRRPSYKHIPTCDLALNIETDVIPYYRTIIEEMKKNGLSHLVATRLVMRSSPPPPPPESMMMPFKRAKKTSSTGKE